MDFFLDQLENLLTDERRGRVGMITYVARAAYVPLGGGCLARVEYVTQMIADKYEAVRVTILNVREGKVDSLDFRFSDYFEPMPVDVFIRRIPLRYQSNGILRWCLIW